MPRFIFLIIILVSIQLLFADIQKGNIGGRIMDKKTQQPVIGANIVVEGTARGAASDMDGHFMINGLRPGSYNLSVHYLGYKTLLKSNVIVNPKKTTIMHIRMEADILQSETVEVTASYFENPKEALVSTRTMDFEEIRRSPGASLDIQRVMQALPAVVSASDQNNEIIIRGGNPGENLFLMDEIEIPNPNHFSQPGTGGGPINMINTMMVREVDFYAAAFPAKYGDKASSVMDISLREGSRERFQAEFDMGMAGAGFLVEGPINSGKGSYVLSARKSYLDLLVSSFGLVAIPRYHNLQGKLTYDLSPKNTLIINGLYGGDGIKIEDEGSGGYSRGAENVDTKGNQYAFGATVRTMWNPQIYSKTTLSHVHSDWLTNVYRKEAAGKKTYFKNESKVDAITLKTDFGYQISKNTEFSFGASYKNINFNPIMTRKADTVFTYDRSGTDPDTITGIKQIYPDWQVEKKDKSFKSALYAQLSTALFKKLHITAGLRYQYFDYNDYYSFSPRLGLSYYLGPKTTLSVGYGKHFQSPAFVYFAWNDKNKELTSYSTEQVVLGFQKIIGEDIKITAETYYKNYKNLPMFKRFTTADPFDFYDNQMINAGDGKAYGVELFFQKKLTKNFSSIISYAWSVSQTKDLRDNSWYNGDYDYRNVFTFIGGYKIRFYKKDWFRKAKKTWWYKTTSWLLPLSDEVEWSLKYRYLGGRPYTPKTYHPEYHAWIEDENQSSNSVRLPEYSRLDIRLDKRFFFDSWNMVNYFDIANIFKRKNIWEYQYNHEDGTKEKVLQFQPMLVGGVIIEF